MYTESCNTYPLLPKCIAQRWRTVHYIDLSKFTSSRLSEKEACLFLRSQVVRKAEINSLVWVQTKIFLSFCIMEECARNQILICSKHDVALLLSPYEDNMKWKWMRESCRWEVKFKKSLQSCFLLLEGL
jgi:hypothetical protein